MELRHLRYFIAVAEQGSVRAASERIHVTQPALSRQIMDLESELGVTLFERTSRGLKLTEIGGIFLSSVQRTLLALEEATHLTREAAAGMQGVIRIGFTESAGWTGVLPTAFSRFQKEAPQVKVELVPLNTTQQLTEIESQALDGGFLNLFAPLPKKFRMLSISRKDVVMAVPQEWEVREDERVSIRYLSGKPVVGFPRSTYPAYYDQIFAACTHSRVTLDVVQEVSTVTAIMALVSAGLGAAVVISDNRARPPARVKFLDFHDFSVPIDFSFIHLAENSNPALLRFRDIVRQCIADGESQTGPKESTPMRRGMSATEREYVAAG
ncbi:LysR family transcriptional regulator [Herbaspirillum lusitanum]|uniref:LysR family transcriptional regulator n=2 Tax=Herbaspirillum lusitanum TaxID=213312 RepID=A0ABW9A931_9BURK